jgi:uncharacterized protein HemX
MTVEEVFAAILPNLGGSAAVIVPVLYGFYQWFKGQQALKEKEIDARNNAQKEQNALLFQELKAQILKSETKIEELHKKIEGMQEKHFDEYKKLISVLERNTNVLQKVIENLK